VVGWEDEECKKLAKSEFFSYFLGPKDFWVISVIFNAFFLARALSVCSSVDPSKLVASFTAGNS